MFLPTLPKYPNEQKASKKKKKAIKREKETNQTKNPQTPNSPNQPRKQPNPQYTKPQTQTHFNQTCEQKKAPVACYAQEEEITKEHILYIQPAIFQILSVQDGLFAALNLVNNIKQEHLTI